MTSIKCYSRFISLTHKNKAIAFDFDSGRLHNLECSLKPKQSEVPSETENIFNLDHSVFLPCSAISNCGKLFAFSVNKSLLLWNTLDWTLLGCGSLPRSISAIIFSPDAAKIIVADKGGDVYVFLSDNISKRGYLLLGHLSLLFDVIVTGDEKFIITCDRDEKIRVSCYPNAYNIMSYCLGHEEFVTCVRILPHCPNILISSSGDGTIRIWNFKDGKEILKYESINDVDTNIASCADYFAIRKFELFTIDTIESGACVLFDSYKELILYVIKGVDENLTCCKLQNIKFDKIICDLCISNDVLWTVTMKKWQLFAYQWKTLTKRFESVVQNEKVSNALLKINEVLCNDVQNSDVSNLNILYKKQFGNVHAYYKRKNERLYEASKKNKT